MCNTIPSANRNGCFRPRILVLVHNTDAYATQTKNNENTKLPYRPHLACLSRGCRMPDVGQQGED